MGLLDDAIHDHLELQRLRGSDPAKIARKEQEALGADTQAEQSAAVGPSPQDSDDAHVWPDDNPPLRRSEVSAGGEETIEFDADVGSVVQEDQQSAQTASGNSRAEQAVPEELMDWEMSTKRTGQVTVGSDERLDDPEQDLVEDVLEETPDFLRDTPEQERLWFEQRPPRDFDFNK